MTTKIATVLLPLFLSGCALFQPPGSAGVRRGQAAGCPTASPWTVASGLVGAVQGVQGNAGAAPPPSAAANAAACAKDTDCKGDRVCDRGACVSPRP